MRKTLITLLVTAVLGLSTACGGSSTTAAPTPSAAPIGPASAPPGGHDRADVTFASEMVPHHTQALTMVALTRGHDLDPEVAQLVDGIKSSQSKEVATMSAWLRGWGQQVDLTMDQPMNGMLSDTQLKKLAGTTDDATFQRLWLTSMTQHHQGAIPMAQTEIAHGKNPAAIALAKGIVRVQQRELAEMRGLLGDRS